MHPEKKKRKKIIEQGGLKNNPKPRIAVLQPYVAKILKEYIRGKTGYDYAFPSQKRRLYYS